MKSDRIAREVITKHRFKSRMPDFIGKPSVLGERQNSSVKEQLPFLNKKEETVILTPEEQAQREMLGLYSAAFKSRLSVSNLSVVRS